MVGLMVESTAAVMVGLLEKRRVVVRVRSRAAEKVEWMVCLLVDLKAD